MRYLDRMQPLRLLVLRTTLGAILVAHASHKVWGHMHEYADYISSLGIPAWLGHRTGGRNRAAVENRTLSF